MKQFITIEQFNKLNEKEKEYAKNLLYPEVGNRVFCTVAVTDKEFSNHNGTYTGVVTDVREDGGIYRSWDTKWSNTIQFIDEKNIYPLFSYGQLVELLHKLSNNEIPQFKPIDELWNDFVNLLVKKGF